MPELTTKIQSKSNSNIKAKLNDVANRLDDGDETAVAHDKRIHKLELATTNAGDELGEVTTILNDRIDTEVYYQEKSITKV